MSLSHQMQGRHRPDGAAEMARLLDEPPVLHPGVLRGDTRLTQRWAHGGLRHDYMHGIAGHIAVGCHKGDHPISWRIENKRYASRTSRTAFTLIPEGHDGHWDIGGLVEVSHVYLTQERLQACADVAAVGSSKATRGSISACFPPATTSAQACRRSCVR